jgi:hypothetical protein
VATVDLMSNTDADLITFAARRYQYGGQQLAAMRRELDLNATQFWQQVNQTLDDPVRIAALPPALWPIVKRLDEQRLAHQAQRAPRRLLAG